MKRAPSRLTRRSWIAIALGPVGLALALLAGFAGEGDTGREVLGAIPALVALAGPTAGLLFAITALRAREESAKVAALVATVELLAIAVALPLFVISEIGSAIGFAVVVVVLALYARHSRNTPLPA